MYLLTIIYLFISIVLYYDKYVAQWYRNLTAELMTQVQIPCTERCFFHVQINILKAQTMHEFLVLLYIYNTLLLTCI